MKKKFSRKLEEDHEHENKKKTVKVDARQNIRHKTGSRNLCNIWKSLPGTTVLLAFKCILLMAARMSEPCMLQPQP